jgi:beta-1,4-mannosyl-glycoprotein beta-1,4-N-acetylglucosaminyltransferase
MIYDCFTFFNELDLLEIRLNELASVVDKFVLVEATHTFTGQSKSLHFQKNKKRFAKFNNKIIHIVATDLNRAPSASTLSYINKNRYGKYLKTWEREFYQRNSILRGLDKCRGEDLILISDVDEIPNKKIIHKLDRIRGVVALKQRLSFHYINCVSKKPWLAARAVKFSELKDPQEIRNTEDFCVIENGGWHFAYFESAQNITKKIKSFSHQEYNSEEYTKLEKIKYNLENGLDPFERLIKYYFIKVDNSFPNYIAKNIKKFSKNIKDISKISLEYKQSRENIYKARSKTYKLQLENDNLKQELKRSKTKLNDVFSSREWRLISYFQKNIKPLVWRS